jgi:hypothetical protein
MNGAGIYRWDYPLHHPLNKDREVGDGALESTARSQRFSADRKGEETRVFLCGCACCLETANSILKLLSVRANK